MAEIINLELTEDIAQRARTIAERLGLTMEDVLQGWLSDAAQQLPAEIVALAKSHWPDHQQDRLSDLLDGQRENTLSPTEQAELESLLLTYRRDLMRKAQALQIATDRKLLPRLS